MKIATICGWGLGTSMILKLNIEDILKRNEIDAKVISWDAMSFKSQDADIIVAAEDFKQILEGNNSIVVLIKYITDMEEVEQKTLEGIKKFLEQDKKGDKK